VPRLACSVCRCASGARPRRRAGGGVPWGSGPPPPAPAPSQDSRLRVEAARRPPADADLPSLRAARGEGGVCGGGVRRARRRQRSAWRHVAARRVAPRRSAALRGAAGAAGGRRAARGGRARPRPHGSRPGRPPRRRRRAFGGARRARRAESAQAPAAAAAGRPCCRPRAIACLLSLARDQCACARGGRPGSGPWGWGVGRRARRRAGRAVREGGLSAWKVGASGAAPGRSVPRAPRPRTRPAACAPAGAGGAARGRAAPAAPGGVPSQAATLAMRRAGLQLGGLAPAPLTHFFDRPLRPHATPPSGTHRTRPAQGANSL
jgi:hypothetical protein